MSTKALTRNGGTLPMVFDDFFNRTDRLKSVSDSLTSERLWRMFSKYSSKFSISIISKKVPSQINLPDNGSFSKKYQSDIFSGAMFCFLFCIVLKKTTHCVKTVCSLLSLTFQERFVRQLGISRCLRLHLLRMRLLQLLDRAHQHHMLSLMCH